VLKSHEKSQKCAFFDQFMPVFEPRMDANKGWIEDGGQMTEETNGFFIPPRREGAKER